MLSILFKPGHKDDEELVSELWEHGTTGILEEPEGIRAFFEDTADTASILAHYVDLEPELRNEEAIDWQSVSREGWDPLLVGKRFFIAPSWVDAPTPEGRMRLIVDSTIAFGTGRHETTQLMLEFLENENLSGKTVADIGCGTGILSEAAQLLGAGLVIGCDLDPSAVTEARKRMPSGVYTGSAESLHSGVADIVLANILPGVLEHIAYELKRIAKPDGLLVLSGFIAGDEPAGFTPQAVRQQGDWLCWVCPA